MRKKLPKLLFAFAICLAGTLTLKAQWTSNFKNPLPIPDTLSGPIFNLDASASTTNFDPQGTYIHLPGGSPCDSINNPISTWCYNNTGGSAMTYLGPTLMWWKGTPVDVNLTNSLTVPITTHWHGGNFDPRMDGGPQEPIDAGTTWHPNFPILEETETMWYHSHLHDSTTQQVQMGLAGLIINRDPSDTLLSYYPHTYGLDDIPLVIQEKGFMPATGPQYTTIDVGVGNGGRPRNEYFTMVNGAYAPVKEMPSSVVRFRILNGSIRKTFQFGFSTKLVNPQGSDFIPMTVMATDGGYIDSTYAVDSLIIMPGERYEVLVDFANPSIVDTLYWSNLARSIPSTYVAKSGEGASGTFATAGYAFAAFPVNPGLTPPDPITSVHTLLNPWSPSDTVIDPIVKRRHKNLAKISGVWLMDTSHYHMNIIDDTIIVNTREAWTIHNTTGVAHPFHIHKIEFRVVKIDSLGPGGAVLWTKTYNQLPPEMKGHKDVVRVMPNWALTYYTDFDSFPAPFADSNAFMYHCHILTHEDSSMMHQFVVVTQLTYDSLTSIAHAIKDKPFIVFPNPGQDKLIVKGNTMGHGKLRFTDALGRVLLEEHYHPLMDTYVFDVVNLPRGLIIVEWISSDGRYAQKVLLE